MTESNNDTQPRVWVAITGGGKQFVLAGLRGPQINKGGLWGLFGGRVDPEETLKQAAVRELREEIGLRVGVDKLKLFHHDTYKGRQCTWFTLPRKEVDFSEIKFTHEVCDFEYGDHSWNGREDLHYSLRLYLSLRKAERDKE